MTDKTFDEERRRAAAAMGNDERLKELSLRWMMASDAYKYTYNFTWLGRPIIQFPQDMLAMQEIIWAVRPELVVETGVARGGSLVYYASLLHLLGGDGRVLGIDIEIRPHNRLEIERHPLASRIELIEGSSTAPATVAEVFRRAKGKRVLVALDSNHTHEHVLEELVAYSPLVRAGSYLVVFDTIVEDLPAGYFGERPWNKGNNPRTAVREFLKANDRFVVDRALEDKLLISVAPGGYLRCTRDP
jgi:cephalosporin hydroxylase